MKTFQKISLILLLILHLFILLNIKYTVWPEMILYPYLMLNGFSLYRDIILPYFPLLPLTTTGFFAMFGLTILNLKVFTYLIILLTDVIIYLISKKIYPLKLVFLPLTFFIFLQPIFGGNQLWFELLLTPFILSSLWLFFLAKRPSQFLLAILLFSLAVLIKQNTLLFLLPIIVLLVSKKRWQELISLSLVLAAIFLITALVLGGMGLMDNFYQWTILLPLNFNRLSGFVSLPALRQYPFILFPLVVIVGIVYSKYKKIEKIFWLICLLIALSFSFPRYEDFHSQVLIGLAVLFLPLLNKKLLLIFTLVALFLFGHLLIKDFHQPDRFVDQTTLDLAQKTQNYDSVYILNGPELSYYFAQKLPPKPWATNFPWYFEYQNFDSQFTSLFAQQKINYIVMGDPIGGGAYALGNYLPPHLINFIQYNYFPTARFDSFTLWQKK